jgi:hypothetical protein
MLEQLARDVVDGLRERGVDAHLAESGVYRFGVRVVLGDGREALWGADGTVGLAAQVLRDGDLVGFVPDPEGSDTFDAPTVVDLIARTDYSQPQAVERPAAPPPAPALPLEGGVFRRFLGGFRTR